MILSIGSTDYMIGALTLDQLRVLVAIADEGSFSAAGRRLRRVQSAVSQSVATLEAAQGVTLFSRATRRPLLTEAGRALVAQARLILSNAARFEAMAASAREGVEPALAVAIDPLVPTAPFLESVTALRDTFPDLALSFSTEGLGGAERRLRAREAALAFCLLLPSVPEDIAAVALLRERLVPAVSPTHPLARLNRPATREDLSEHVQLVLADPSRAGGPNYGVVSPRVWRFVELGRRLDFLLAGLGWCRMPEHLVAPLLREGRLVSLPLHDDFAPDTEPLTVYAAHLRAHPLGRAGQWLLADLTQRLGPA